jgi:hypothetical protein
MKLETAFLNNAISIIDALKDSDLQTGRRLYEDIAAIKGFSDSPSIEYREEFGGHNAVSALIL